MFLMSAPKNLRVAVMRYRTWHVLAAMMFVSCWAPVLQRLLALEAMDHPTIPQTTWEIGCFYVGAFACVGIPFVALTRAIERRVCSRTCFEGDEQRGSSESHKQISENALAER